MVFKLRQQEVQSVDFFFLSPSVFLSQILSCSQNLQGSRLLRRSLDVKGASARSGEGGGRDTSLNVTSPDSLCNCTTVDSAAAVT